MKEVEENELFVLYANKRPILVYIKHNKSKRKYELEIIAYREEQKSVTIKEMK